MIVQTPLVELMTERTRLAAGRDQTLDVLNDFELGETGRYKLPNLQAGSPLEVVVQLRVPTGGHEIAITGPAPRLHSAGDESGGGGQARPRTGIRRGAVSRTTPSQPFGRQGRPTLDERAPGVRLCATWTQEITPSPGRSSQTLSSPHRSPASPWRARRTCRKSIASLNSCRHRSWTQAPPE
jgi:hypothetical protein